MDPNAEPSLLLAKHHLAQREHIHNHNRNQQHNHNHHRSLHKRQAQDVDGIETVSVIQTISVIQQIDIDRNGNTVSKLYTPTLAPILTDDKSTAASPSGAVASGIIDGAGNSQVPLTPSPNSTPGVTSSSIPSSAQTLTPSPAFPSLVVGSNSTSSLISGANSSSRNNFSNSTILSNASAKSSRTSLISWSSSTATNDASSTSTSISDSILNPSATGADGLVFGGGNGVTSSASPSSTSIFGGNEVFGSPDPTPTPVIIGSVVSSIAGVAIIVVILVYLWRWKHKKRNMLPLGNGDSIAAPPAEPAQGMMVERRSFANVVPAALANLTGMKRFSERTDAGTISSTAGSERGFYKVSGRKIESVLTSGGDGYGGPDSERGPPVNPFDDRANNTLSASSWYSDADGGIHGGPGTTSPLTRLAMPPSHTRDSGVPVSRPSPARTPVIEHGPFTEFPLDRPPTRPDGIGRSRPSQDGSHTSKFQEVV